MFGNKKDEKSNVNGTPSNPSSTPSGAINSLVEGTRVEGNITARNDIRIDGELKGSLQCKGRVIILTMRLGLWDIKSKTLNPGIVFLIAKTY